MWLFFINNFSIKTKPFKQHLSLYHQTTLKSSLEIRSRSLSLAFGYFVLQHNLKKSSSQSAFRIEAFNIETVTKEYLALSRVCVGFNFYLVIFGSSSIYLYAWLKPHQIERGIYHCGLNYNWIKLHPNQRIYIFTSSSASSEKELRDKVVCNCVDEENLELISITPDIKFIIIWVCNFLINKLLHCGMKKCYKKRWELCEVNWKSAHEVNEWKI